MAETLALHGGQWPEGFFNRKASTTSEEEQTAPDLIVRWVLIAQALPGFATLSYGRPPLGLALPIAVLVAIVGAVAFFSQSKRVGHTHRELATWYSVIGVYLVIKLAMLQFGEHQAAVADVYTAYKAWLFLIPVIFFMGRNCFSVRGLVKTTKIFLGIFFFKYTVAAAAGFTRPVVWIENNYELMLLIGMFFLAFAYLGRRRSMWSASLIVIVALSGSRSAILELAVCLLVLYWRPTDVKFYLQAAPGIGLAWAAYVLAKIRIGPGGLRATDRYSFLEVFRAESSQWHASQWLFGTDPLTPLTYSSCGKLSYYQPLFSGSEHDVCYSVIMHLFFLRALFDHGLIGLTFLIAVLAFAMRRSGVGGRRVIGILGIGLANATSVAAFDSDYSLLLLVLAVGVSWNMRSSESTVQTQILDDAGNEPLAVGRG